MDDVDADTGQDIQVETERIVYPPRIPLHLVQRQLEDDVFLIPYDAQSGRRFAELDDVFKDKVEEISSSGSPAGVCFIRYVEFFSEKLFSTFLCQNQNHNLQIKSRR